MRSILKVRAALLAILSLTLVAAGAMGTAWSADDAPAAGKSKAAIVADIMGGTQLRHFKLWFAGYLGNWPLASYEVEQMRLSFEDAARVGLTVGGAPLSKLIEERSLPPLKEVQAAIDAKSVKGFAAAFDKMTADCNACHVEADVGFIKMQVPTASPFSNQVFPP